MAERSERQPVIAVEIMLLERWKTGEYGIKNADTATAATVFEVVQLDKANGQLVVKMLQSQAEVRIYPSQVKKVEKSQVKKLKLI